LDRHPAILGSFNADVLPSLLTGSIMVQPQPHDIKVTDPRSMEKSADSSLGDLDSPTTADGSSQPPRPKSASSDGMLALHCPSCFSTMALVMYGRQVEIVLSAVVRSSCVLILLEALILTATSLVDNGQKSGQKSPTKLIRNQPSKNGNIPKTSVSPTIERPATAIDPLSHVCVPKSSAQLPMHLDILVGDIDG
jgi:hypothetical protein